jgi:hypothetical protein
MPVSFLTAPLATGVAIHAHRARAKNPLYVVFNAPFLTSNEAAPLPLEKLATKELATLTNPSTKQVAGKKLDEAAAPSAIITEMTAFKR